MECYDLYNPAFSPQILKEIFLKLPDSSILAMMKTCRLGRDCAFRYRYSNDVVEEAETVSKKLGRLREEAPWLPICYSKLCEYARGLNGQEHVEDLPDLTEFRGVQFANSRERNFYILELYIFTVCSVKYKEEQEQMVAFYRDCCGFEYGRKE